MAENLGNILLYQTEDNQTRIEVVVAYFATTTSNFCRNRQNKSQRRI